ncbi:hypothetical protein GF325_03365 [Candidatus Bathyarchaeota archaeon]|nr:hypothetical protein [Candidatus Bathyarchaeota archaeon]
MKLLVSPRTVDGARAAIQGGADIIDCKNPDEGSLGANFPWIIAEMKAMVDHAGTDKLEISATMGDMPFLPGTASLAATGIASIGVDYIKIGVHGPRDQHQARSLLAAVVKATRDVNDDIKIVAAGYADQSRINTSLPPMMLIEPASEAGCDVVMVDTSIKDGKSLLDFMTLEEMAAFCDAGVDGGMEVALAGKVKIEHVPTLKRTGVGIIGVRSAVCTGHDRVAGTIDSTLVAKLKAMLSTITD